jgi:predicted nucleotidyltransferase
VPRNATVDTTIVSFSLTRRPGLIPVISLERANARKEITMRIGQVARQLGISADWIRNRERAGSRNWRMRWARNFRT